MNVLSLFSGIGGLDLGLERAGMTITGQVEIDPWCRQVLAKHWPEVPRHDDVRTCAAWWQALADTEREPVRMRPGCMDAAPGTVQGEAQQRQRLRPDAGDGSAGNGDASPGTRARGPAVDLVCGGFPCQPVSLAGKGLAQADSRWLWPATRDVIRDLGPRWVLLENVPGLLGRGMGDVLGDLAALGYDAEWDCIPACFVGAPHIRDRVWIVAYPQRDPRHPCGPRDASEGTGRRHADRGPVGANVADSEIRHGRSPYLDDRGSARGRESLQRQARGSRGIGDVPYTGRVWQFGQRLRVQLIQGSEGERNLHRWPAEPGVGRVAHGIPRRVDRLRGLGNAVVPQVAEHIGRLIMQAAA